jgi:glycosyltransferase involved in cell wall biosynthesis
MHGAPAVSILLVAHNAGPFLRPAVESLWRQTFTDFELVLVDNASSDGSVEALPPDPRLRVVKLPRNVLQVGGWQAGLPHCRGDYVALMDADDLVAPDRLARQYEFLQPRPDFVAVGARAQKIDTQDRPCGGFFVLTDEEEIRNFAEFACPLLPGAMMLRRGAMEKAAVPVFWPQAGDYDLVLRVLELGRVGCVDDVLYLYRQHGASVSAQRYAEQVAAGCLARLAALRRRTGRPECIGEIEKEMAEWEGRTFRQGVIYASFARRFRREGFGRLAILAARRAVLRGQVGSLVELFRSLRLPAAGEEHRFRLKLALCGPVKALCLRSHREGRQS